MRRAAADQLLLVRGLPLFAAADAAVCFPRPVPGLLSFLPLSLSTHRTHAPCPSKTNSFAVDRFVGSYCEPGLGGTGKLLDLPITGCAAVAAGVVADGGVPVGRDAVYSGAPPKGGGHYIALAVKPAAPPEDTSGDFHLWRLDAGGAWSHKAGDTLVRNTLRGGAPIRDVERDAGALGVYTGARFAFFGAFF